MPTERKLNTVEELRGWMSQCSVAISTDYSGLNVTSMTDLRRALRDRGVQFRVVKNSLAHLAADVADRPVLKEIIQGPTGIAFSYGEPTAPAKALTEFIRSTRSPLRIKGGVMDNRVLTSQEVDQLATLPSREELIARLMGQLQAPVSRLVFVLQGPISGLARVLQRRIESLPKEE